MRFDEVDMQGSLKLEILPALPAFTIDMRRRIVLINDTTNDTYSLYFGSKKGWTQLGKGFTDNSVSNESIITNITEGNEESVYNEIEEYYNTDGSLNLTGADIFVAFDGTDYFLTSSLPNQTGKDNGEVLQTDGSKAFWKKLDEREVLPDQTGQKTKYLQTNGNSVSWQTPVDDRFKLPSQPGYKGKFLRTDGTDAAWEDVSNFALPDKSTNSNKFLQVNSSEEGVTWSHALPEYTGTGKKHLFNTGDGANWETLNLVPEPSTPAVLETDGDSVSWSPAGLIPDQTDNDDNVLMTNGTSLYWSDIKREVSWITEDTTWYVDTIGNGVNYYRLIQDAFDDLERFFVHPSVTLTIHLSADIHYLHERVLVRNRGGNEGDIKIVGSGNSLESPTSYSTIMPHTGGTWNVDVDLDDVIEDHSLFILYNAEIYFEKLNINWFETGAENSTFLALINCFNSKLGLKQVYLQGGYRADKQRCQLVTVTRGYVIADSCMFANMGNNSVGITLSAKSDSYITNSGFDWLETAIQSLDSSTIRVHTCIFGVCYKYALWSNLGSIMNIINCTFDFGAIDYSSASVESTTYPLQTYYSGGGTGNEWNAWENEHSPVAVCGINTSIHFDNTNGQSVIDYFRTGVIAGRLTYAQTENTNFGSNMETGLKARQFGFVYGYNTNTSCDPAYNNWSSDFGYIEGN
jgi:hypothetical protein